eukprot:gnl/Dysnectes_brevis/845_a932_4301.p1 GENE.gnl/Dysnectes_brevis/845_a932_4301~~gnl/Dysnectes_brevis/845_a932_4301.p1  ORF type:complete len:378 (-),score=131.95 gnl/Dysnectes_brevis/845_a932_4301:111-1244(-)
MAKKGAKKAEARSRKSEEKGKARKIEDLTFGLKNKKKSKKVQQKIQAIKTQVGAEGRRPSAASKAQRIQENARKEKEKANQLMAMMRASLKQPKVPPGMNAKDFMCVWNQHGCCHKGDKCRFSHDVKKKVVVVAKKKVKKPKVEELGTLDLFTDMREQRWEHIAKKKATASGRPIEEVREEVFAAQRAKVATQNFTDKICIHFMQACEERSIGWRWKCPNEEKTGYCQYRHFLPLGWVSRSELDARKRAALEKELDDPFVEEDIERRRQAIEHGTPVTPETFKAWKSARLIRRAKEAAEKKAAAEKLAKRSGDRKYAGLSGRALFAIEPQLFGEEKPKAEKPKAEAKPEGAAESKPVETPVVVDTPVDEKPKEVASE